MPYTPTIPPTTFGGVQPTREGEQPTRVPDEQEGGAHSPRHQFELPDEGHQPGRRDGPEDRGQHDEEEEPRHRQRDEEEPQHRCGNEEEEPQHRQRNKEEPRCRHSD